MKFKEILNTLLGWGNNHPQIKFTQWGKLEELTNTPLYPTMFVQPVPSSFSNPFEKTYSFNIYFLDKLQHDNNNRLDAFNDMLKLGEDLVNKYDVQWLYDNGFNIELPVEWDYVDGELNDFVGGVVLTINIITNFEMDCLQPDNN